MFRIEVGHDHNVEPGNIVGAIANEAGIDAQHIGHISIFDTHSEVELPKGMPREIFEDLKKAWVCGQKLNITRVQSGSNSKPRQASKRPTKKASSGATRARSTETKTGSGKGSGNKKTKKTKLDHKELKKNKNKVRKNKKRANKDKGKPKRATD